MFNKRIYSFINNNQLIKDKDYIIVAVSSGPDSMFLLTSIMSLKEKYNLNIAVAHVNHHTRGNENLKELNLVKNYCQIHEIPFYISNYISNSNDNFHESARNFRYAFFKDLAVKLGANKIAIAHHEDDQIETILFKICRGNYIGGYLGMKPIYELVPNIFIIRPLLSITKRDIIDLCHKHHIPYAVDSSNYKNTYTRNYLRNQIIPYFKEIQPDFNDKMIQFQVQLTEVYDFLEEKAIFLYQQMIISFEKERIILDLKLLKKTHKSLLRLILLNAISDLTNNKLELTFEKMKNIFNIISNDKANVAFDLGKDYFCIKEYDTIKLQHTYKEEKGYSFSINKFGVYELTNGRKISFKKVQEKAKTNNKSFVLCYNNTIWPLVIRTRIDGDYIKTKVGTKKISRLFIDNKIPVNLRNSWPLLVDENGAIIWVIGLQKVYKPMIASCNEYILVEVL